MGQVSFLRPLIQSLSDSQTAKMTTTSSSSELRTTCMSIPDDFPGFNKDLFCLPDKYKDSVSHVLISHGMVQVRFKLFFKEIKYISLLGY